MPVTHVPQNNPQPSHPPAWVEDVSRAAQHLARLSLESASQAALIVRAGRLWAYAGELPQAAAEELALAVASIWERNGGGDIARFVYLGAMKSDYLVYATSLATSMILTLVYDVATPFTQIRSQANLLRRSLETINGDSPPGESLPPSDEEFEAEEGDTVDVEAFLARMPPLFEETPPPPTTPSTWTAEFPAAAGASEPIAEPYQHASSSPLEHVAPRVSPQEAPQPATVAAAVSQAAPAPSFDCPPGSPVVYNLSLAVVLAPRLPQHLITGDLSARLGEWVPQLCLAFGCRLEHIAVRPDHIAWVASLDPATAAVEHVRQLRHHTSHLIFEEFPRLLRENPSGDFWAPGEFVNSTPTPPPPAMIQAFIQQVRQHQGVARKTP